MRYALYYWPEIQGRGEFVRLALEAAGAGYDDVARMRGRGVAEMMRMMQGDARGRPPLAPPFLRAGRLVIGQTACILQYLGPRLGLAPAGEPGRLWAHQLQLTIADLLVEVHDSHHPIASSLYYVDQRTEALRRAGHFVRERLPKYLRYFEGVLQSQQWAADRRLGYVDLSLFQVVEGLRYAFPRALRREARRCPKLLALRDRVAGRPRVAAYLASPRRIAFNDRGIFRHYPELDA